MESVSSSFLIPTAMGPHGHEQERGHRAGRIRRVSREEMKTIYLPTWIHTYLPLYQTIYVPSYVTTYLRKYEAN